MRVPNFSALYLYRDSYQSSFRYVLNGLRSSLCLNKQWLKRGLVKTACLAVCIMHLNGCGGASGFAQGPSNGEVSELVEEPTPQNALIEVSQNDEVVEEGGDGNIGPQAYTLTFIHAAVSAAPMFVTYDTQNEPLSLDYGAASVQTPGISATDAENGTLNLSFQSTLIGASASVGPVPVRLPANNSAAPAASQGWVIAATSLDDRTVKPFFVPKEAVAVNASQVSIKVFHAAIGAQGQPLALDAYFLEDNQLPAADQIAGILPLNTDGINYSEANRLGSLLATRRRLVLVDRASQNILFESVPIEWALYRGQSILVTILDTITAAEKSQSPFKVLVVGNDGASTFLDEATGAALQVIHASPDSAALEVFLERRNDTLAPQALVPSFRYLDAFPNARAHIQVSAGNYDFFAAPDTDQVGDTIAGLDAQLLKAGSDYRVVLAGRSGVNSPLFQVALSEQRTRPLSAQAAISFLNLVADETNAVSIYVAPQGRYPLGEILAGVVDEAVVQLPALSFLQTTEVLHLQAPADYDVHVVASDGPIYSGTLSVTDGAVSTLMVVDAADGAGTIGGGLKLAPLGDAADNGLQAGGNFVDLEGGLLQVFDVRQQLYPDQGLRFEQLLLLDSPRTITSVGVRTDWWQKRPTEVAVYEAVNGQKGRLIGFQQFPDYLNTICGLEFNAPCSFPDVDGSATAELRVGVEPIQTDRVIVEIDGLRSIANGFVILKGFALYGVP